jgi:hypothetical protein
MKMTENSFEIINKKHKAIDFNHRLNQSVFVKFMPKEIYFSAQAGRKFKFKAGNYIHFINDGERIYFYQNDGKDGFKLIQRTTKDSFMVMDVSLVRYLVKQKNFTMPQSFHLSWREAKIQDSRLIEIEFNNPFE